MSLGPTQTSLPLATVFIRREEMCWDLLVRNTACSSHRGDHEPVQIGTTDLVGVDEAFFLAGPLKA